MKAWTGNTPDPRSKLDSRVDEMRGQVLSCRNERARQGALHLNPFQLPRREEKSPLDAYSTASPGPPTGAARAEYRRHPRGFRCDRFADPHDTRPPPLSRTRNHPARGPKSRVPTTRSPAASSLRPAQCWALRALYRLRKPPALPLRRLTAGTAAFPECAL